MDLLLASGYEDDEEEDMQTSSSIRRKRRRVCVEQDSSTVSKELCVRSVPHIRGNWAGHVFVPISGSGEQLLGRVHSLARRTIQRFSHFLQEVVTEEKSSSPSNDKDVTLVPHSEWHLSLSRPFYLPLASIHSFRLELQTRLAQYATPTTCCCLTLGPEVVLLTNDEGTRTFLCLQASSSSTSSTVWVRRLISNVVNPILQDYGQEPYYETPHIHVSIASIPGQNLLTQYPHMFPQSNHGISVLKLPQQPNSASVDDTNNMSDSNSASSNDDDDEEEDDDEDNSVTVQYWHTGPGCRDQSEQLLDYRLCQETRRYSFQLHWHGSLLICLKRGNYMDMDFVRSLGIFLHATYVDEEAVCMEEMVDEEAVCMEEMV
eukprot:scaffold73571_cov54-Attheya_sp.AAC.2